VFNSLLEVLARIAPLYIRGNRIRSGTPNADLPAELRGEIDRLEAVVRKTGVFFPRLAEIQTVWKGRCSLPDALQYLRDEGRVKRVGADGYVHAEAYAECVRAVGFWFAKHESLGVGDLKEIYGMTRKHAIPLLELLDADKFTVRDGNVRRKGPALAGAAE